MKMLETDLNENDLNSSNLNESNSQEQEIPNQQKGHEARQLTDEEKKKLENDRTLVTEFKQKKFELEAKKNWDLFYRRNKTKFFKDRYWTFREFDELNNLEEGVNRILLEIGCGVGNFMYPLIKQNKNMFVYACDFSSDAIQLLKANEDYDTTRCFGFCCDATKPDSLKDSLPPGTLVDIVTLIFVLSAIHPEKMHFVVENIAKVLKPGGIVLVRDYGVNDHSMIRFDPGHKLADKFYVRQDGTRTFFFSLEEIDDLFLNCKPIYPQKSENNSSITTSGIDENREPSACSELFKKVSNEYVFRETVNMKENLRVPRVFIQSKYIRC